MEQVHAVVALHLLIIITIRGDAVEIQHAGPERGVCKSVRDCWRHIREHQCLRDVGWEAFSFVDGKSASDRGIDSVF